MKDKLELKHLAPYLPYRLKMYGASDIWELKGFDPIGAKHEADILILDNGNGVYDGASMLEFSPILRPLSDLTKENRDGNIIYEWLSVRSKQDFDDMGRIGFDIRMWSYKDIQVLFEHHYDVFNLIEKGLALDYNTIK